MIAAIIRWSVTHRALVLGATALLLAWGALAVGRVPVDALPDLAENQVLVFADWPGRSSREVEDHVTQPLSVRLQGVAGVRTVRATSMFGFALVTVIFDDAVDRDRARMRVLERLGGAMELLPEGVRPRLGPDATALGWVFQYYLEDTSGRQDLGSLRALQDDLIRRELAAVPDVAEVASIGGFVREWQVEVSAARLKHHGLALDEVVAAIARSHVAAGGGVVEENGLEFAVRVRAQAASVEEIEAIAVAWRGGRALQLGEIAAVQLGGAERRGALDVDGRDAVGGTVVMRAGANAQRVVAAVKARLVQLERALPAGVRIRPFYDRSELVERTIDTLRRTLIEAVVLVTLVHVIFLFHFRSILIVTLPLPASILIAFVLMKELGIASHILSLTGIAVALGVLVDAAIVITENVIRRGAEEEAKTGRRLTREENTCMVLAASRQVGRPIVFAMAVVILAFVPVFALGGQEGKLFHPLAWTKTFAMIGATVLAVTLVPVLCTLFARGPFHEEGRNRPVRALLALYDPALDWALGHRVAVLGGAATLFAFCCVLAFGLPERLVSPFSSLDAQLAARLPRGFGSEFMPALDEGALLFMPVLPPGTSLTEMRRILAWQDRVIRDTPEVATVVGKLGRFDTATDPAPIEMIETTIRLKPREHWRAGMTRDKLVAELGAKLAQVPGYVPGFLQPIEARTLMLSTGTRAQLALKLHGDDLETLQARALELAAVVERVPGASGVSASRSQGRPQLEITPDLAALARHGLSATDVARVVETGLGGMPAAMTLHGRERRAIRVRFERADRDEIERIAALPVTRRKGEAEMPRLAAPAHEMDGGAGARLPGRVHASPIAPSTRPADRGRVEAGYVALGQVAAVRRVSGPSEIVSENGRLVAFVQANVRGRDLGGFVAEVQRRVAAQVALPPGVTLAFSGQFEHQLRAQETLRFVIPAVVLVAFLVLMAAFGSAREAAHLLLAVPFALTGGVLLQWALGFPFSVAVWVGYIALFGTAIQTGVVMVTYLDEAVARRRRQCGGSLSRADLLAAVKEGARGRLRPKVMTVATTVAGLVPIFWSTRAGADVMQPIAAPVVGGMISSLVHILIVTPVIYLWLRERELKS